MWNGKKKAVTFSFDDGTIQDIRLIEIFNKYNLKATFNLNSGLMDGSGDFEIKGKKIRRLKADGIDKIYRNHEISLHTVRHDNLTTMTDDEILMEISNDKRDLEDIFNYEIVGMAYPYGAFNEKIMKIAADCGVKYARTTWDSGRFDVPDKLLALRATCRHRDENIINIINDFLNNNDDKPKILNIWGHSYEFDVDNNWKLIEDICALIAGKDDIFYGTNREVYLPWFSS